MDRLPLAWALMMFLAACETAAGARYEAATAPLDRDVDPRFMEDYIGPGDDVGLEDDALGYD